MSTPLNRIFHKNETYDVLKMFFIVIFSVPSLQNLSIWELLELTAVHLSFLKRQSCSNGRPADTDILEYS